MLLAIALAAVTAPALGSQQAALARALAAVAAYAPRAMREQGTPGLSLAITDRTHTLGVLALGYANRETQATVSAQTRFAIGSISKSMTALSLMELADEGRLDLGAPVRRYLPWFSIESLGGPILVRELLSHTAGIPDDFSEAPGYVYDVLALRSARTLFAPGTSWSYSNDGFATAGAMLARLDRRAWAASLQARVFAPLGMDDSSPVFTPEALADAATGYQLRDNDRPPSLDPPLVASPPMDFVNPAGSVLSTPEDMARYMRFYLDGGRTADGRRLISAASFAAMTQPARLADGSVAGARSPLLAEAPDFYREYGYGLSIFDEDGDRVVGHTGGVSGYTACMQMNLTRGFGAIAFANLVEAPLHPCAIVLYAMRVLRAQSLGQALPSPPPPPDPARVARPAQYAGTYRHGPSTLLAVAAGDRLALLDGPRRIALYPRGEDLFWADDPRFARFLLRFGRNPAGRVVELSYGSQWYPNERYAGPRRFAHPASWNGLVGRYENTFDGTPAVTRVVIVKNRLTLDGTDPLSAAGTNAFTLGSATIRFDAFAGGLAQRLRVDGTRLYRVELP